MELCSLLTVPCTYCSNEMQNEVSDGGDLSALYNKFEQAHKINPRVMYLAYEAGSFSEPDLNKQEFLEHARRERDKNLLMWCVTCAKAFEGCLEQTSSRECPRCKNSDGVRKVLLDPNVLYEDGDMTLPQDNNSKNPGVFWKGTIHDHQPMILNLQLKFQEKVNKERIEWIWGESDESRNSNALTVAKKDCCWSTVTGWPLCGRANKAAGSRNHHCSRNHLYLIACEASWKPRWLLTLPASMPICMVI